MKKILVFGLLLSNCVFAADIDCAFKTSTNGVQSGKAQSFGVLKNALDQITSPQQDDFTVTVIRSENGAIEVNIDDRKLDMVSDVDQIQVTAPVGGPGHFNFVAGIAQGSVNNGRSISVFCNLKE